MHPHLKRPRLLLEQIEACHKRGIRVPVYTTVRWDERVLREKPEWLCRDVKGDPVNRGGGQEAHFCYDRSDFDLYGCYHCFCGVVSCASF